VQDITEPFIEPLVWAKLSSMSSKYNSADIREDKFKFGKKDNLQLLKEKDGDIKKSISNEHFIIQVNNFQKFFFDYTFLRLFAQKVHLPDRTVYKLSDKSVNKRRVSENY
jgi:hypothetical protein